MSRTTTPRERERERQRERERDRERERGGERGREREVMMYQSGTPPLLPNVPASLERQHLRL